MDINLRITKEEKTLYLLPMKSCQGCLFSIYINSKFPHVYYRKSDVPTDLTSLKAGAT